MVMLLRGGMERISLIRSLDLLQAVPIGGDLDAIKGPFLTFVLGCVRGIVKADRTGVLATVDRSTIGWLRQALLPRQRTRWRARRLRDLCGARR